MFVLSLIVAVMLELLARKKDLNRWRMDPVVSDVLKLFKICYIIFNKYEVFVSGPIVKLTEVAPLLLKTYFEDDYGVVEKVRR